MPWVPYEFPDGHVRAGLLGRATFLSLFSHPGASSPTLRGKAVREHLLCQTIPPPPGDVDFSLVRILTILNSELQEIVSANIAIIQLVPGVIH